MRIEMSNGTEHSCRDIIMNRFIKDCHGKY